MNYKNAKNKRQFSVGAAKKALKAKPEKVAYRKGKYFVHP